MAHTAPPGYDSNYFAILDLIRFGPAIWTCAQFGALLYHAERSTAYGKSADQHSEGQALDGIYSTRQLAWVRGPVGMSRASWYSANAALVAGGVLQKRRDGSGRGEVVEYEIDWRAVRSRIEKWKEGSRFWTLPEARRVQILDSKGLNFGPFSETAENAGVENKAEAPKEGSKFWTLQSDCALAFNSQSDGLTVSRDVIQLELEAACGARAQTDGPAKQILQANQKLDLPRRVIGLFLQHKAANFRSRGLTFHGGLLAKAFCEEIIGWLKSNRNAVHDAIIERDRARQQQTAVAQMPGMKAKAAVAPADPAFAQGLVGELKKRVGKLR